MPEVPLTNEEIRNFRMWREERNKPRKLIVGISGASGAPYGIKLLQLLHGRPDIETHLVASPNTRLITKHEMGLSDEEHEAILNLATVRYGYQQMEGAISSGSFVIDTLGMIIIPCSVNTLGQIANGIEGNLLSRAAFCTLKERRPLLLVPREPSVTRAYLENCIKIIDNGGMIMFPEPAFYHGPMTVEEIINQTVQRALDKFGIEANLFKRWETPQGI